MVFQKINDVSELTRKANIIRRHILEMIGVGQRGHFGGSLSAAEMVAALYFRQMSHNPEDPKWPLRDRFILSKGHAAPVQYAALAECGYFPKSAFSTFKKVGSILQGHPDMEKTPGVEANTGSLGQGLSLGAGMALGLRKDAISSKVFVMMGDGELGEGQLWEAATVAAHYKLDNLVGIIDKNNVQAMGFTCDRIHQGSLSAKWQAFGWKVFETDGHNMEHIVTTLDQACLWKGSPVLIISHTIKGKGVSFAENTAAYHNNEMNKEQFALAMFEIEKAIN